MTPADWLIHADELTHRHQPTSVDLRRAVSGAYYALFHTVAGDCACEHVRGGGPRFDLIYRSVEHARIERICRHVANVNPNGAWSKAAPTGGFDASLRTAATLFIDLKAERHAADYSPATRLTLGAARQRVADARRAIAAFKAAPEEHRRLFLTLLLCDPRG